VIAALDGRTDRVSLAADNGPSHSVVSGAEDDVAEIVAAFAARGIRTQPLKISHAFHSPLVDPALDELEAAARAVPLRSPSVRLVSNVIDAAPGEMVVGLRVTLAWDEIENGMFLPRFRKASA